MNFQGGNRLVMQKLKSQNDRYHKKKLIQIRNSKLKEHKNIPKLDDRKGYLMSQQRKQQIQKQNAVLFLKMNKILDKKLDLNIMYNSKPKKIIKTINNQKNISYQNIKQRIGNQKSFYSQQKFDSDWLQVQKYKKSISKHRSKPISSHEPNSLNYKKQFQNNDKKLNQTTYNKENTTQRESQLVEKDQNSESANIQQQKKKEAKLNFQSTIKFFQTISNNGRQAFENKCKDDKFHKPQQILERIILYKKSHIVQNQKNYLIEISFAYKKLFILAFDMNNQKNILRLILNENRYTDLLDQHYYNFNSLATKINISQNGINIRKQNLSKTTANYNQKDSQYNKTNPKTYKKINQLPKKIFDTNQQKKYINQPVNLMVQTQPIQSLQKVPNKFKSLNVSTQNKPNTSSVKKRFRFQGVNRQSQSKNQSNVRKNSCILQQKTQSDLFHKQTQNQQIFYENQQQKNIEVNNNKETNSKQNKIQQPENIVINNKNQDHDEYGNESFEMIENSPKKK